MDVKQYRERLAPAQAADGINAANANARRLAEDEQALFDRGSVATAASLAILAIEEKGKVGILRGLVTADSGEELREGWKRYRRHTEKNQYLLIWDALKAGASKLSDFADIFSDETAGARRAFDPSSSSASTRTAAATTRIGRSRSTSLTARSPN